MTADLVCPANFLKPSVYPNFIITFEKQFFMPACASHLANLTSPTLR